VVAGTGAVVGEGSARVPSGSPDPESNGINPIARITTAKAAANTSQPGWIRDLAAPSSIGGGTECLAA
jgi:hypothetical protein